MYGFYKGYWITFWREIPGWAAYFGTFEYLKNKKYNVMLSGGFAGLMGWVIAIP